MEAVKLKTISSSALREQVRHVINEVGYGQAQYIVEKFGEPTAAIISMEDFSLLQAAKQRQATVSLQEMVAAIRERNRETPVEELEALIEQARSEFFALSSQQSHADESRA